MIRKAECNLNDWIFTTAQSSLSAFAIVSIYSERDSNFQPGFLGAVSDAGRHPQPVNLQMIQHINAPDFRSELQ